MNKRRRRIARSRRAKRRLIREMRTWSKCNYTALPKRGRLKRPAERLSNYLTSGWENLQRMMAPVLAFGACSTPQAGAASKGDT